MHAKYATSNKHVGQDDVKEVSLLLSVYYDGGQLLKRWTTSAWLLMVSILTISPPIRGKGLFMLSSDMGTSKTLVERFLIEQFVNELSFLDEGLSVS
jgi:hypothetical protein